MKPTALLRAGAIAIAFVMSGGAARAGVITLDVSATMFPLSAVCSPTCTLGGDIMIDNSNGAANSGFVSADVTAAGFVPSVGPFTEFFGIAASGSLTRLEMHDSASDVLIFLFSTTTPGSLVGYMGGSLDTDTFIFASAAVCETCSWNLISGSLTPAAIPEPPSASLMLSALAGLGVLYTRRRLSRTAPPAL